jgi:hypothetical protein
MGRDPNAMDRWLGEEHSEGMSDVEDALDPLLVSRTNPVSDDVRQELRNVTVPEHADPELQQAWHNVVEEKELAVPSIVLATAWFYRQCGLELGVTRKLPTRTCPAAAACRLNREGKMGIAAKDELKTLAFRISKSAAFQKHIVLFNLADDSQLGAAKANRALKEVLGAESKVSTSVLGEELRSNFGAYYRLPIRAR